MKFFWGEDSKASCSEAWKFAHILNFLLLKKENRALTAAATAKTAAAALEEARAEEEGAALLAKLDLEGEKS